MSPRAKDWLKRLLVVPPTAIGAAVLAWQLGSGAQPEQGALEEVTRAVRVIEAAPLTFVPRAIGYGTAQPDQVWEAVAQVGGKITEKHPELRRGRLLEAGTVILRIDPASYELAMARRQAVLDSARAELAELEVREANTEASIEIERRALSLAERELSRAQTLLERGNTSQAVVDQAETAVLERQQRLQELQNQLRLIPAERTVLEASITLQEAELEEARLDLERTTIRMPFDGRIAEVDVEPTQFVSVGQVLAVAEGIDVAEIDAQFPIGQLAPLVRADVDISTLPAGELSAVPRQFGLEAAVRLRTQGITAAWDARFDRISEGMDPQTRTMGVIVAVDEPYRKAIPGKRPPLVKDMFVEVELRGRPWEGAIVVPRIATHRNDDGESVLYLADAAGRLEIRPVTLGPVQGDLAVVEAGLAPGERVVVSDLTPAIAGMRLDPRLDTALAARLRRDADGERGTLSHVIRYFAGHPTAANLLMLLLIAAGLLALPTLRRETFPDFSVDVVEVRVVYPGASAEEVEEAICQRIEDAVERLTNVEETRCEASEGLASAAIEMRPGQDVDRFLVDVRTEIEAIDDFPDAVETVTIRQLNITDPVVSIAIAGAMAAPDLKVYAEQIKNRLIRLPEVSQVAVLGFSDRQIRIALDDFALRQHGLSATDVAEVVGRQSVDLPAGTVETQERDVLLRFADQRRSVQAFEDLVVIAGERGAELRLGDIAEITDTFELDEERIVLNGKRAALLEVTKTKDQDTLTVMTAVERFVEREQATAPPDVTFALTRDVASIVEDRLTMLLSNGMQGIVLVFLVLWLFFSFRFSFWVAMGLPASFLGALFGIWLIGYSIDMLTMVALLIAVGLLMDDAIVIAENVARHLQLGKSALAAAVDGTREVAMGVIASFITSVCVFAPLAFLEGDIGKVLKVVPVVLIIVLSVSLVEAFLILPHHLAHAMGRAQPGRFRGGFDRRFEAVREQVLGRLVDAAVRWRYLTVGLVLMVFLLSLATVAGGVLKFRAFPDLDGDTGEARILLPAGTPLADTEAVVARVVAGLEEVDAALTPDQPPGPDGAPQQLVRNVLVQYNTNADAFEAGPHLATVTADLLTAEVRNTPVDEIFRRWRETVGTLPDVIALTFKEPQVGPAGLPIEIRLQGDDLAALKAASQDLQGWLASFSGVTDLMDDLRPGKPEIRLRLREGAFGLGLDATEIARQLRAAYYGSTAAEIQVGPESFEIDVRLHDAAQSSLGDLDDFAVALPGGGRVPLAAVAEVETGRGVARIARVDGRRTVTLRGEVDNRITNLNQILARTSEAFLPELLARYPVSISLEGEAEEQEEAGASLQRGFLLGLLGIFLLLSFQFKSYIEPVIVMVAIPLAAIGVIWGHIAMGLDLTMPSMLGAASLAGVVVNDSILLVAFVKLGRRSGAADDVVAAASRAARHRFRPVLLTSLTTVAGLLPLLFERSLQAQVLVPLVTSLAFGLMASTVLVLIVVPTLYAILNDLGLTTLAREERAGALPEAASAPGEG